MSRVLPSVFLLFGVLAAGPAQAQDEIPKAVRETLTIASTRLSPSELVTLRDAIRFAAKAHDGQMRDGGKPALLHVLRVANEVMQARTGRAHAPAVVAAVLHDTVEDTKTSLKEIRARYGKTVARYVSAVTLDPVERFGNDKRARDRAYYERLAKAPRAAHEIKFHDRLDNVRDMSSWGLEGRLGYLKYTRETVVASLRSRSPDLALALAAEVDKLTKKYQAELAKRSTRMARYRRADGTLSWKPLLRDGVLREGAGLARFSLALFLKELAVVIKTGDRLRIDEFFSGLLSTDFFLNYGLFAAGARAGEVAYVKFLQRFVKPRFISGLLKTNAALAAGLALPQIVRGELEGKPFVISLAALGLSSAAVRSSISGISWVAGLSRARRGAVVAKAGTELAKVGKTVGTMAESASAANATVTATASARTLRRVGRLGKLASVGGWVYAVAETVVILVLADEIERRIHERQARKQARAAMTDAGLRFFEGISAGGLTESQLTLLLRDYQDAWTDYRGYLYQPALREEARLRGRLEAMARKAKRLHDSRNSKTLLATIDRSPALKRSLEARYGSVGAYLATLARGDEAKLESDAKQAFSAYRKAVAKALAGIYDAERRGTRYLKLSPADRRWLVAGMTAGGAGDAYGGRTDAFARMGRDRAREHVRAALGDPSRNRIESYDDELAALTLAEEAFASRPALAKKIREAKELTRRTRALDHRFAKDYRGLFGAITTPP